MSNTGEGNGILGRIFNIQRYSTEDGPSIHSTIFLRDVRFVLSLVRQSAVM